MLALSPPARRGPRRWLGSPGPTPPAQLRQLPHPPGHHCSHQFPRLSTPRSLVPAGTLWCKPQVWEGIQLPPGRQRRNSWAGSLSAKQEPGRRPSGGTGWGGGWGHQILRAKGVRLKNCFLFLTRITFLLSFSPSLVSDSLRPHGL